MKCGCGHPECKRELKGTSEGKLYVVNHFSCPKVKQQIEQLKNLNLLHSKRGGAF